MDAFFDGAQSPIGQLRTKSRPVTAYNTSAIVMRGADHTTVDPEFDEDTFTRSPVGDTLYCLGAQ